MKILMLLLVLALLPACSLDGTPPPGTVDASFGDPDCDGMVLNILGVRLCLKGLKSAEQRYNEKLLTDIFDAANAAGSGK
jgi:hypothetical protein